MDNTAPNPAVRRVARPPAKTAPAAAEPVTKPGIKPPTNAKSYVLPTEPVKAITSLEACIILLYGEPKIGKTGTAAQAPDNLFLFTEKGGKGISRFEVLIESWEDFKGYVRSLRSEARFKTITIDTVDRLYDMCNDYMCEKKGVEDPGEQAFGAGWRAIRREFETEILRLTATGRGLIMISHANDKTFRKRNGIEYNKLIPSAGKQAAKLAMAMADITIYYGYYGEERLLTLQGSDEVEGGTRMDAQFWAKDGTRVHSIPAGSSAKETWENLKKAFNNEQPTDGRPQVQTGLSDVPPKPKARRA